MPATLEGFLVGWIFDWVVSGLDQFPGNLAVH